MILLTIGPRAFSLLYAPIIELFDLIVHVARAMSNG